jgi:pimeloyl-ACP methyl ester carboxylesterase
MYDRGQGQAVIVVPGVQGRWEWMRPALDALSRYERAISYSLCGDIGSGARVDPELGFDSYLRQLDDVFERTGVERAAVCGVSYGGFIALRYAATRPERVSALILVSAPAPGWSPSERQLRYIAHPLLSLPAFLTAGPIRTWPEIHAALPTWPQRIGFSIVHGVRLLMAPMNPMLMASRVRQEQEMNFAPDCARISAPTLVVTGDGHLDTVVPVSVTQRYRQLIPGSQYVRMDGTGHLGMVTQPDRFAHIVKEFLNAQCR